MNKKCIFKSNVKIPGGYLKYGTVLIPSHCTIMLIIAALAVVCIVNIVTVLKAFHTAWNWAVCGTRPWPKHLLCKETIFLWILSIIIKKLHYIGNSQGKPQEDEVRLMKQLLGSPSGDKGTALGMPVHLLWVTKCKQGDNGLSIRKKLLSETALEAFTEKGTRALALSIEKGSLCLYTCWCLSGLTGPYQNNILSSEFDLT